MVGDHLRRGIRTSLDMHDRGVLSESETVERLAMVLNEDHHEDILAEFPPERRAILLAGYAAALQRLADNDCLETPPSAMTVHPIMAMRGLGLAKHLLDVFRASGPWLRLSAVCDPSFEMPWAIRIEKTPDRECQLIHTAVRAGPCEYEGEPPDVVRQERQIEETVVNRLETLWARMLLNVRANSSGGRADGVTYHFANRRHAGQVASPQRGSLPWRLANVAELLANLATSDPAARTAVFEELNAELAAFGV